MEITLLKAYLIHEAGETVEVTDARGNYLISTKQAEIPSNKKEKKEFSNSPNKIKKEFHPKNKRNK